MRKTVRNPRPWVYPLVALALALEGCGGSTPITNVPLGATVDRLVQADMQQFGVPSMTVALARNGNVVYAQGYGVVDLSTQQLTQPATVFEIGSITKQFTAALIMRLKEGGKLNLDDSITTYLPGYGFPPAVTLRMLLTHTSGLADFTNFADFGQWVRHGISETAALTEIGQAGLEFQPGSQYAYSNSNYYLLGSVIEKLSGQPYATDVQAIFTALGLNNTFYEVPPPSISATGYFNNGSGLVPAIVWNRSAAFAAGALSSNVHDLAAWDAALLSGRVVSQDSFQQMTTPGKFFQNNFSYGFGLALSTYNNRRVMWHNGQIGGFTAENAVFLDDGFSVIVLTNDQDYNTDQFVIKVFNTLCGSSQPSGTC